MSTAGEVSSSKRKRSSSSGEKHPPQSPAKAKSKPRVFSSDDSLNLLKAFHEILKDNPSPATAATLLFNRIGKSLSAEITQTQMIEKLRKLRQKYSKQLEEEKSKPKNPLEEELYKISHKIWGENPTKRNSTGSSSKKAAGSANGKKKAEPKTPVSEEPKTLAIEEPKTLVSDVIIPEAKVDLWKKYSFLMEEVAQFPGNFDMGDCLMRLDESQLGRLNNGWKLQKIKEAEMLVKRTALLKEQTKLILEALEPSIPN